jgi:photosystem II stability/assembly factor-like uncharacterized protein
MTLLQFFKGTCQKRWLLTWGLAVAMTLVVGYCAGAPLQAKGWIWRPVRIGAGGWMRGMVINPHDPNVRFARGDVDNAYRWSQASGRWVPMKVVDTLPASVTTVPTNAGASALASDPNNPHIVLCAFNLYRSADLSSVAPTIGFNVYRSTDGGRTFTAGNLSLTGDTVNDAGGERLTFDPNNSKIAYLGTPNDGLYRSQDGGTIWSAVVSGPIAARFPRFDPAAGTILLHGLTVSQRIYCTTASGAVTSSDDGGMTWTTISRGQAIDGHAGFATVDQQGNLWLAAENGEARIYRCSRAGVWTVLPVPHGSVSGIAIDPHNVSRIFVMTNGGSLARSRDGGRTWADLGSSLHYSSTQTIQWLRPSPIRPDGHYESTSNLYMDTLGRLWVSGGNDGVLTCRPDDTANSITHPPVWTSDSQGIEEMVAQSCVLPPGGQPVLSAEDETCFTIQNPELYTALHFSINLWKGNNGLSSAQDITYCPNQPRFLVVTTANVSAGNPVNANYASYSTDGGLTWTRFASITHGTQPAALYGGEIAVSVRPASKKMAAPGSDDIVWIGTNSDSQNSPAPFYSTDGGQTWTQTHSFDAAPGAFVYQGEQYMGPQWGPWNLCLKVHALEADPIRPGVFYANLAAGGFWRSTDGGRTWAQPPGASQLPLFAHHGQLKTNPNVSGDIWFVDGYEGATAHGLWHSMDGGNSFTKIPGFDFCWTLALGKAKQIGGYPSVYVYGKRSNSPVWGIFASFDAGRTWSNISGYPTGLVDAPASMTASWDTFGTVYVGFRGNSYIYGTYHGLRD